MRKFLLAALITTIAVSAYSQSKEAPVAIRFSGKLNDWKKRPTIYYSMNNEPFSKKRTIQANASMEYKFDLSKTVYKNMTSGKIVFTTDSSSDPLDEDACVHRLDIEQITNYARSKGKKEITIKTDLEMEYNCLSTVMYQAEGIEANFAGRYILQTKDTTYSIELRKPLNGYRSTLSPMNADLISAENGGWSFDSEKNVLKIYTSYRTNPQFGIVRRASTSREFKATQSENGWKFESADGSVLTKLN
jgi:hypothetical protein